MAANSRWIDIPTQSGTAQGYLSLPPAGRGPGLLLIQEIFGVNSHIRGVADQYALDGYVVLAPDLMWRLEPRVELGYDGADMEKAKALMSKLDIDLTVTDMVAATQALRELSEVTGKVAAVGFCLGGRMAYMTAAAGAVDVAVCYYGGGIQNALDKADAVKAPILFHYGELDQGIPLDAVEKVKARFAARDDAPVYVYPGANHGFNCWARASYNPHASGLAHGRTLTFLGEHM